MKSFLDLQDIDPIIDIELVLTSAGGEARVVVNGHEEFQGTVQGLTKITCNIPLLDNVDIKVFHTNVYLESLKFDNWEARPQYAWEVNGIFVFETHEPFYSWFHTATGQGWLLKPQ